MTVDGAEPVKTGFFLTGRDQETDVRYEITLGDPKLEVELGEGIRSMNFEDGSIVTETGIRPGTEVRLKIALEEGYTGVEVQCEDPDIQFRTEEDNTVVFSMPTYDLKLRLRSYQYRTLTFLYNYGSYGTYKTVSVREDGKTEEPPAPFVDGLTFRGWKEKEDGSGDSFIFGGNLVTDQILYADWTWTEKRPDRYSKETGKNITVSPIPPDGWEKKSWISWFRITPVMNLPAGIQMRKQKASRQIRKT